MLIRMGTLLILAVQYLAMVIGFHWLNLEPGGQVSNVSSELIHLKIVLL